MTQPVGLGMVASEAGGSRGNNEVRRVIASAFEILDLVAALEPVRLGELTTAAGIPRATVHRLLQQLMEAGAIRRAGGHYFLGASLLRLGAAVTPHRRLRSAARRPMAELAAATGAAVLLSGTIGRDTVFLDIVEARTPLELTHEPGAQVPPRSAQARAHAEFAFTTPVVDAGRTVSRLSCGAMAIPLGTGGVAAVSVIVAGSRPPAALLAAIRATAARIGARLHETSTSPGTAAVRGATTAPTCANPVPPVGLEPTLGGF
jgi:IclR helix-turn-helix domain